MSDLEDLELPPEQQRARDALRALPPPRARAAFRARLKREFASGSIATRAASARARPRSSFGWGVWAPAAAAAALLVAGASWLNRGPDWTLASATGSGFAVIDDRPILLTDQARLAQSLRRGGKVRLSGGGVELATTGLMAIEITPGTDAIVPPLAGRWFDRRMRAEVHSGEIRVTTGRSFHGARLAVTTPEASVEVTGTTLAVICESTGTCVCVMEGRVMVGAHGAPMMPIESGRLRYVFNDGRPPEEAEMRPVEKEALGTMMARHAGRMQ